jgi:hypothetical protein
MTVREDELRRRDGSSRQPYEQRFSRYAHNAATEARFALGRGRGAARGAQFARNAAENARKNGDEHAGALYTEMAELLDEIAEAQKDVADIATDIAHHFGMEDIG